MIDRFTSFNSLNQYENEKMITFRKNLNNDGREIDYITVSVMMPVMRVTGVVSMMMVVVECDVHLVRKWRFFDNNNNQEITKIKFLPKIIVTVMIKRIINH